MDKKQKIIAVIFVAFLAFILVSTINNITGFFVRETSTLGYCPTMRIDATELAEENNYKLIEMSSSAEVLQALNNGLIDYGLIGRKANLNEINPEIEEEIIESGHTLISRERQFISEYDLMGMEIHTYLDNEETEEILPNSQISYYETKEEAINTGFQKNEVVLISWEDWEDSFHLTVVFENPPKKVRDFRGVFLYS